MLKKLKEVASEISLNQYKAHELIKIYSHNRSLYHLQDLHEIVKEYMDMSPILEDIVDMFKVKMPSIHQEFKDVMQKFGQEIQ